MKTQYYQGDIAIVPVKNIGSDAKKIKEDKIVLAEGEATGHAHTIETPGTIGFVDSNDSVWLEVKDLIAEVCHQEHATIKLPKGKYKVVRQREYTPEEIRNVKD